MKAAILFTLLLDLLAGASGTACSAGYTHKKTLTGLSCTTAKTDGASCNTNCCEADVKTCGGLNVACGGGKFTYSPNAKQPAKDAWAATAATEATKLTACCTAVAKCGGGGFNCPAGKKKGANGKTDAAWANTACSSDPVSCATTAGCCEDDASRCGGLTKLTQPANGALPTCDAGTVTGTDDGWKATTIVDKNKDTKIDAAEYKASCCGTLPTCSSKFFSCPVGYKKDSKQANFATHACAKLDPSSCAATTAWAFGGNTLACCVKDTSVCGGLTGVACAADKYFPDSLKISPATDANKAANCCATKATCALATCTSGWKAKASAAKLSCPSDAASCVAATCCEKDVTKCGGLSAIACATGFYDESILWNAKTKQATKDAWNNKPATEATKNTACCTAKAVCAAPATTAAPGATTVTTTPAATVTTTPAAPALKFSEHKIALENNHPFATNMALLGVGGLVGMSVLMAVQGVRSRVQAATTEMNVDSREVDTLLVDDGNLE